MPPKYQPQSGQTHWAARSPRPVGSPGPSGFGLPNAASSPIHPGPGASPGGSSVTSTSSLGSLTSVSSIHSLSPQPNNRFQPTPTFQSPRRDYPPAYAQRTNTTRTHYLADGTREEYSKTVENLQVPFREGHATKAIMDQNGARMYQSPNLYQHHQHALTHHHQFGQRNFGSPTPNQGQTQYSLYCTPRTQPTSPAQTQRSSSSTDSGVRSFGSQTTFEEQQQQQQQQRNSEPDRTKRGWWGS